MSVERVRVIVSGFVQGVCFRASAREVARDLGLGGWVRNLPDGSVEVMAEGERPVLERLADWCRRGPPDAEVTAVETTWLPASGQFAGFNVTR